MRALVFTGPSQVEMQDVDEPVPADDEVLVTVKASGICGSELHGVRHPGFRVPPLVMGHEFSGLAADGRRVTANPLVSCGTCDSCERGDAHLCRQRKILGIHRAGAFAERVAVPAQLLHPLPDHLSWERGAMVEPLANAVHAWNLGYDGSAKRVAVIGAGTIGLVCLLVAQQRGAQDVVVVDLADDRINAAKQLGGDTSHALEGEFDLILDAVGAPSTRKASVEHLRPGGTAVWIGLHTDEATFSGHDVVRQEKRVLGSFSYSDTEFGEAIDLAHVVDLDWSKSYPLDDGASVFTELMNGRTDVAKALLRP